MSLGIHISRLCVRKNRKKLRNGETEAFRNSGSLMLGPVIGWCYSEYRLGIVSCIDKSCNQPLTPQFVGHKLNLILSFLQNIKNPLNPSAIDRWSDSRYVFVVIVSVVVVLLVFAFVVVVFFLVVFVKIVLVVAPKRNLSGKYYECTKIVVKYFLQSVRNMW